MEHLQCLVEIVDNGLVFGIATLYDDAYIVVSILVANATKEYGELVGTIVLLKPALKEQATLALAAVTGVADIEYNGGIDTEELNEYCHDSLFDLSVALSTDVAYIVDIKLVSIAAADR